MINQEVLQLQTDSSGQQETKRRWRGVLTVQKLREENRLYAATLGVSQNNACLGFRPAYLNRQSGEWVLSRFRDGTPAPIHILDGLPESWVRERDAEGHVVAVEESVVSGFVREGRFYTREEAARLARH